MLEAKVWWNMISNYNTTIFPMQIIAMVIGVLTVAYFFAKQNSIANRLIKSYFALCNLWIGIMFFLVFGKEIGAPLNIIQGCAFTVVGILMTIDIFTNKTVFVVPKEKRLRNTMYIMLVLIAIYVFIGIFVGRGYDQLIYFGTLPCPTTALALVFMMMALPKANKVTYILLLIWAIPFAPLIQIPKYHVYEDGIMFLIGVIALVRVIRVSISTQKGA